MSVTDESQQRLEMSQPVCTDDSGLYRITTYTFEVATHDRTELINVTELVSQLSRLSSIKQGQLSVQTLHTTTALFISEWQEALRFDILQALELLAPRQKEWRHNDATYSNCDRKNADSHIRGIVLGQSLTVQIHKCRLVLGTWQQIILAELDGPRRRSLSVQFAGI